MTPARPRLLVNPDLCQGCRRGSRDCERACKLGVLSAGTGYIYVDWEACDGCLECVDACNSGALRARSAAAPAAAQAHKPGMTLPTKGPRHAKRAAGSAGSSSDPSAITWTQGDALVVLLVILGSILALDFVLSLRFVGLMPPSGRVFARVAGLAATYGIEMLTILALARRRGLGLTKVFGLRPATRGLGRTLVSAGLVLGLLVASRALTTVYGLITQALGWNPTVQWSTDLTRVFGEGWAGLALAVLLAAVVGPVVEEIAFRGVVQSALTARAGRVWGIAITAALFGLYHFDWWMFVPTFVLGLALGWLAENRRGLPSPIALHMLYNGITVVAVFWVAAH